MTKFDPVEQASMDSFPASDPPGWGSSHATTCEPEDAVEPAPARWLPAVLGAIGFVALIGIARRIRDRHG